MRLIPGYEVYWRDTGVSQIGVDPRCAVVLGGLTPAEQRLLGDLPRMFDVSWLRARGNELGLSRTRVSALQQRLAQCGVLIETPPAAELTADQRYWHMAARAGIRRAGDRRSGVVELRCTGTVGIEIGTVLAEAGVGTILVTDSSTPISGAGGSWPHQDSGDSLRRRAAAAHRAADPHVRTSAARGTRPDLVVTVDHHVVDPVPIRELVAAGTPHLTVLVTELAVRIGPFTRPGEGACSTCLELHRSATDHRWAPVATQAALRPPAPVETTLARWAAVTTAQQVLAVLDGRQVACESATLESTAWDGVPRRQVWQPHPRCTCAAAEADAAGRQDSSGNSTAA